MSSPIGIAAKCVTAVLDFFQVIDSVNYLSESNRTTLATANVANRLMLLGFTTIEIKKLLINPDNSLALANLKASELPYRCYDLVLQIFRASDSQETGMPLFEKTVIVPLSDIIRVAAEKSAYQVRDALHKCSEERSIPHQSDALLQKLHRLEGRIRKAFCTRIAAETALISWGANEYASLFRSFMDYLGISEQQEPRQVLSLVALSVIPPFLHNDEILKKYICSITLEPIRDPVQDPTTDPCANPALYEKKAIEHWLTIRSTSPMTQRDLTVGMLIPKPEIKCIIDLRLQFHQENMETYLAESPTLAQNLTNPNNTV